MKLELVGYHLGERLDLQDWIERIGHEPLKSDSTFAFFQLKDSYIYVKHYGVVVFVNCTEDIKGLVVPMAKTDTRFYREKYTINVNPDEKIHVNMDEIRIPEVSDDLIHIISLNIAQSLALNHYQNEVDKFLTKTHEIVDRLEKSGRVNKTRRELAKFIGEIMNLRNRMADNLYIFEAPPFAWKEKQLTEVDELLNNELDIENRYKSIQHSLNVVNENYSFFIELLQHKHSSLLEWIIIILILFEVVHILLKN